MNVAEAFNGIDKAVATVTRAAAASGQTSGSMRIHGDSQIAVLVRNLHLLEAATSDFLIRAINRPLPAVDAAQVGSWTAMVRRSIPNFAGLAASINAADWIPIRTQQMIADSTRIYLWLTGQTPPETPPATSSQATPQTAPAQAAPQVEVSKEKTKRVIGISLMLASLCATGFAAYSAYAAKKKRKKDGLEDEEYTADPTASGQVVLDSEIPGARLNMTRTPDGDYIASVRKGHQIIARKVSKKPGEATSGAVRKAIDSDMTIFGDVIDAEIIEVLPAKTSKVDEKKVEAAASA